MWDRAGGKYPFIRFGVNKVIEILFQRPWASLGVG